MALRPQAPTVSTDSEEDRVASVAGRPAPTRAPRPQPAASEVPKGAAEIVRAGDHSPLDSRVVYRQGDRVVGLLRIDEASLQDGEVLVVGWSFGAWKLALSWGGVARPVGLEREERPDVAQALKVDTAAALGFRIHAPLEPGDRPTACLLRASLEAGGRRLDQSFVLPLAGGMPLEPPTASAPQTAVAPVAARIVPPAARAPVPAPRDAAGHLESVVRLAGTGELLVSGWAMSRPGVEIRLESEGAEPVDLSKAYRYARRDVAEGLDQHLSALASRHPGFIMRAKVRDGGSQLRMWAESSSGRQLLAQAVVGTLPAEPVELGRWLFGIQTPLSTMRQRIARIDGALIETLLAHKAQVEQRLKVASRQLGKPPAKPEVSIIIPLYGRDDFVEHQMLEFARDADLLQRAEIIYVVDDPRLLATFPARCEAWHALYRVPLRWVTLGVNRGFAGANNLGASVARGRYLLFLNSDAFPTGPGWLAPLVKVLERRPRVGVVGPRLLFPDGSLQHAGMSFVKSLTLGVWTNHHPSMGLDPSLDPHKRTTLVPAVTGACMLVRKPDFDTVKGFDTGYLIGDFEDSDLCLKLRQAGLQAAYEPSVSLVHLERQSLVGVGDNVFRQRVVLYNAIRHERRWLPQIEALADPAGGDATRAAGPARSAKAVPQSKAKVSSTAKGKTKAKAKTPTRAAQKP